MVLKARTSDQIQREKILHQIKLQFSTRKNKVLHAARVRKTRLPGSDNHRWNCDQSLLKLAQCGTEKALGKTA